LLDELVLPAAEVTVALGLEDPREFGSSSKTRGRFEQSQVLVGGDLVRDLPELVTHLVVQASAQLGKSELGTERFDFFPTSVPTVDPIQDQVRLVFLDHPRPQVSEDCIEIVRLARIPL